MQNQLFNTHIENSHTLTPDEIKSKLPLTVWQKKCLDI